MGQADRRGTFQERKAKAIIRNKKRKEHFFAAVALTREEKKEEGLTVEEKSKASRDRIAMMAFGVMSQRSGLSPKEFKRRVLRYNKKGV